MYIENGAKTMTAKMYDLKKNTAVVIDDFLGVLRL